MLDAALIALPYDTPGLNTFEIGSERFYVVLHCNHPLSKQAKITAKQLRGDNTLLLLGDGHCLKDHIVEICKFRNEISPHSFREASLNTLVQMVVNDMGLTLVPEMALPSLRPLPDIHTVPLDVPAPHRRLALVTRPNYPRTVELEALMGLFRDVLNNIRASVPVA
ncbi:hydrogen peroxide-inducible protein activator domain protein [Cardiobacterium valvarum F0432]|uniref:Hydrogen peroxide-inducible protein activator domain protein n=2 Tax=Cardiobacterium valvarum TaxID=194702 RepID=G9ZBH9_9GAMM|nr:hydrogen peroxide-inducible protein activator domain protein [Cardiobacterium valvarum F0432]